MRFTVEEMSLIQSLDHTCRRMVIFDIKASLPNLEDRELKELCERVLKKAEDMSDTEFAAIDFSVDEGDEEDE